MSRALGLALGWAVDQAVGDPRRWHPVAGFGSAATALEDRTYAARRARGAVHVALLLGAVVGVGGLAERLTRGRPVLHTLVTGAATWAVLGGRSLTREAETIERQLAAGDVVAARVQVRNLVGRDTTGLEADEVARACIESLAENTSDAVVAPLLWGGIAGVPGLFGYRAVNTLDAMIGHRSARYAEFGWAAARLDDLVNWVPARLAAALAILIGAGAARGGPSAALRAIRHDAPAHPAPTVGSSRLPSPGCSGCGWAGRTPTAGASRTAAPWDRASGDRPRHRTGPPSGPPRLHRGRPRRRRARHARRSAGEGRREVAID